MVSGKAVENHPLFELTGQISLDDKRARLRTLKAKTTCRKCGAVGHWSGDYECPMSKGKNRKGGGKVLTSPPSSSGAVTPQHHGGKAAGGKAASRPRTVYFSISETYGDRPGALLAYRHDHGRRDLEREDWSVIPSMRAVPPPTDLQDGRVIGAREFDNETQWSVVEGIQPEPMEAEDPEMQELIATLGHGARQPPRGSGEEGHVRRALTWQEELGDDSLAGPTMPPPTGPILDLTKRGIRRHLHVQTQTPTGHASTRERRQPAPTASTSK